RHPLQQFGDCKWLNGCVRLDQDGAVGAHGERGPERILRLGVADRHSDNLRCLAAFLDAHSFLDGNLVERVHRHFDVAKVNTRAVRLDADFHVEIDSPFHGNENFHPALVPRTSESGPLVHYLATAKWPRPYCRISATSMVSRGFERVSGPAAGLVEQHYTA